MVPFAKHKLTGRSGVMRQPILGNIGRLIRDRIASIGLAEPAYRVYELISRSNPGVIYRNAQYRARSTPQDTPIPPPQLRFLVAGSADINWFLEGGEATARCITDALKADRADVDRIGALLDFGCGCGRVLRHWHSLAETRVHGTDYNPRLIDWCREHIPFATYGVNELEPPLRYHDSQFGLVYAISVFTHLTEDLQAKWMAELARVLRPGGYLIISTHGEPYMLRLSASQRKRFRDGQLVVKNNTRAPGSNTCAAYHPYEYVRDALARNMSMINFLAAGAGGAPDQDLYVFRKPEN
jgi:SAM-dependent methyltransferase